MQFTDAVSVAGTRRRDDGYLVADARIARTGVQTYLGSEVGRDDMATVRVYRPGSEVFHEDTLKSAAHRPVTNDHPAEMVTSQNWKQHAVGQTGDEVSGEGIFIRVPLMVSDEATIKAIEAGKQELSAGYTCDLDFTPGTTPTGEAFDAIQKNIRLNHVAVVSRGRAGSQVRIGDGATQWGVSPVNLQTADERTIQMDLRKVLVDGLTVETTDQGAQAIDKLQNALKDSAAKVETLTADHAKAIAAKDGELAKKDAEIDALKGKVLDAAALDGMVQARADLIDAAKKVAPKIETAGLTDAAIRRAAVVAVRGEDAVKDKSEAYIDAAFDLLKDVKPADPVRTVLAGGMQAADGLTINDAYGQMLARDRDAWKGAKQENAA